MSNDQKVRVDSDGVEILDSESPEAESTFNTSDPISAVLRPPKYGEVERREDKEGYWKRRLVALSAVLFIVVTAAMGIGFYFFKWGTVEE